MDFLSQPGWHQRLPPDAQDVFDNESNHGQAQPHDDVADQSTGLNHFTDARAGLLFRLARDPSVVSRRDLSERSQ